MTEFDPIAWLQAVAHPGEDMIAAYVDGYIDDEETEKEMLAHLVRCTRCRSLAEGFGWSAAGTNDVVIAGPWPHKSEAGRPDAAHQDTVLRGARRDDFVDLPLAAASKSGRAAGQPDIPLFVEVVPTADGKAVLGYIRGGADEVHIRGADIGDAVILGDRRYPLGAHDATSLRVVVGLSQEALTIWMVNAEEGDDPAPEII